MKRSLILLGVPLVLLLMGAGTYLLYDNVIQPRGDATNGTDRQAAGTAEVHLGDASGASSRDDLGDEEAGEDENLEAVPKGELTDEGLKFTIPFERGDGWAIFSRQNGLLRADFNIRFPYSAGSVGGSPGSRVDLFLSVDGNHGRQLAFHPSPVWAPNRNASYPPFRMEMAYAKDGNTTRIADEPSFAGDFNISHWARWTATVWIDRMHLLVPGNSPSSLADNWYVGIFAGNQAATISFPEGFNPENPANAPGRMISLAFSKLPERDARDDNPRETLDRQEDDVMEAMKSFAASFGAGEYGAAFKKAHAATEDYPKALWPKFLAFILSQAAAMKGIPNPDGDIDENFLELQRNYVMAAPGQSSAHIQYFAALLSVDNPDRAAQHAQAVFQSKLCTEREETGGFMRLEWLKQLVSWGYTDEAEKVLTQLLEHEGWSANDRLRVGAKLQRAVIAERLGDSQAALEVYEDVITNERDALDEQSFVKVQEQLQFQKQALQAWEKEAELREADKQKKNPRLVVETDKGTFVIELFEDDSPNTVASLVKLAKNDFYDGLNFHRVEPGFVIQGGCPNGDGTGDPGYKLKFEENERTHFRGTVAMARSQDKDSAGSQFYVCLSNGPNVINLNKGYQVVGRVIEGMDVVDGIRVGDGIKTVTPENLRDHEYEPEVVK